MRSAATPASAAFPPLQFFELELKSGREFFYLIWAVLLVLVLATRNLLDSREGRAIRALKGGSVMAEAMGVNTPRSKIVVFTVAALYAAASRAGSMRICSASSIRRRSR
jgi:ABC-type branched-subunit amino acid transport system permease subunit